MPKKKVNPRRVSTPWRSVTFQPGPAARKWKSKPTFDPKNGRRNFVGMNIKGFSGGKKLKTWNEGNRVYMKGKHSFLTAKITKGNKPRLKVIYTAGRSPLSISYRTWGVKRRKRKAKPGITTHPVPPKPRPQPQAPPGPYVPPPPSKEEEQRR